MNFAVGSNKIGEDAKRVIEIVNGSIEICPNPALSLVKLPEYAKIVYHDETANIINLGGQMRLLQRIRWETEDCSLERWS
jgi:hypothetical protein